MAILDGMGELGPYDAPDFRGNREGSLPLGILLGAGIGLIGVVIVHLVSDKSQLKKGSLIGLGIRAAFALIFLASL